MEDWLRQIGLQDRVEAFRDQGITLTEVRDLTDDDLRELGLNIGERIRFRRAIAVLDEAQLRGKRAEPVPTETRAERRPLTVMFVDLAESSAIAERLDAEDLLEVLRVYREACGEAIQRYGGYIARFVGDGILAYFCYPIANENDPERSVRAALEIVRNTERVATPAGEPLRVRVGIATGQVVISDLFAGGGTDRQSVVGSTPNLAARLQGLAPPGGVVVANETHARIAPLFQCINLGAREVRGFAGMHTAWQVIDEIPGRVALGSGGPAAYLTPFFGREAELATLALRWRLACEGQGGSVSIIGDAGIGKSRLVEQFVSQHLTADTHVIRLTASALDQDSPLYPIETYLRAVSLLAGTNSRNEQLEQVRSLLESDVTRWGTSTVPTEPPDARPGAELPPKARRERLLQILIDQVLLPARSEPTCIICEDCHWLDPTTRELLERTMEHVDGRRGLLLLTSRDHAMAPAHQVLHLKPLSATNVASMVQSVLGDDGAILGVLGKAIALKTDGVPLFVEEIARSLRQDGQTQSAEQLMAEPLRNIPISLRESLMARLDRCGAAKHVAQIAAVVGRSVRHDLLCELVRGKVEDFTECLSVLIDAGILIREEMSGEATYRFGHALICDAAYDSLLRAPRKTIHLSVARGLAQVDPHVITRHPELYALHLSEGGEGKEAAPFWLDAARRNLAQSALPEATRLLHRGIAGLEPFRHERDVFQLLVDFYTLLGPAIIALNGAASSEAQKLYGEAFALCESVPEHPSHFPIYWGWWRVNGDFTVKRQRAQALLTRAEQRGDVEFLLQAHHCNWATHYDLGDFRRFRDHVTAGLRIYDEGDFRHHCRLYGNHDPKVCALGALAQLHWMQGRPVTGLRIEQECIALSRQLDHLGTRVHAMDTQLLHRSERRDYRVVLQLADELIAFTTEHGMSDHRAKGQIYRGWAIAMLEEPAQGLLILQEGLRREREIGSVEDFLIYECLAAEATARTGRYDEAINALERARGDFTALGLQFWRPEVLRLLAALRLVADPTAMEEVERLLDEAAALADAQDVAMLGVRIAATRAELAVKLGDPARGERQLSHALARIAEPEASPELLAAQSLIGRLRSSPDPGIQQSALHNRD